MPTYEADKDFLRDWRRLSPAQRRRFKTSVCRFVEDLKAKRPPQPGLGIESFEGREGVFEFRWAPDGRALFAYGTSPHPGDVCTSSGSVLAPTTSTRCSSRVAISSRTCERPDARSHGTPM